MKIRNGFVSNSSSTAFIVSPSEFRSSLAIARRMIEIRLNVYLEENDPNSASFARYNSELIEIIDEMIESGDYEPETPVHFNSCNYDTYIARFPSGFHVATCNNEPWDDIGDYHDYYFHGDDDPTTSISFVDIDEMHAMKHGKTIHHCPSCNLMLSDGYCDKCGTRHDIEKIERLKRKKEKQDADIDSEI